MGCTDFDEYEEEMSEKREFYPEYGWEELPYKAQNAASQFGFTQKEWDNDTPVLGMDKEWDELSPDLQLAAKTLGYDEDTWCEGENEYMKEESQNFINDDWEELPQNVKDAAHILGFDHEVWDNDGKTPHTGKDWHELSTAQQNAAQT